MTQDIYRSSFVQRYHSNPDLAHLGQTTGHHQWGVAVLLLRLFPDASLPLLREALLHDVGEMGTADISAPAKARHPALGAAATAAETVAREEMGVPAAALSVDDEARLRLCDMLEPWLFVCTRAPWVLGRDGWPQMRVDIARRAAALGVAAAVREAMV